MVVPLNILNKSSKSSFYDKNNVGLYLPATDSNCFWGWIATGDRKFESSPWGKNISNFGGMCKIGDIVGVHLEFNGDIASLSYYKNKVILIN